MKPNDSKFATWDEEDSMVKSRLWNSMMPEVNNTYMFFTTTKEIWESYKQTYSKVQDVTQIYQIETNISSTKQGNHLVTKYAQI